MLNSFPIQTNFEQSSVKNRRWFGKSSGRFSNSINLFPLKDVTISSVDQMHLVYSPRIQMINDSTFSKIERLFNTYNTMWNDEKERGGRQENEMKFENTKI